MNIFSIFSYYSSSVLILLLFFSIPFIFFKYNFSLLFYLSLLLLCNSSIYGTEVHHFTIYNRGLGELPISLVNIFLYIHFILLIFINMNKYYALNKKIEKVFFLYTIFVICTLAYYYFLHDLQFSHLLHQYGIINTINMLLLWYLISKSIFNYKSFMMLINIFKYCLIINIIFHLLFFFVDILPKRDIYAVKVTTYDLSFLAIYSVFYSYFLQLFFNSKTFLKFINNNKFNSILCLSCILIIFLSYKRTAWSGFIICTTFLTLLNVKPKHFFIVLIFLLVTLFSITFLAEKRFSNEKSFSYDSNTIYGDILNNKKMINLNYGRFSELYAAYIVWIKKPIFGLGPDGEIEFHTLNTERNKFVHSTVFHLLLKTGVIGCSLYFLIFVIYLNEFRKIMKYNWKNEKLRILSLSFFCGLLFLIPDILFGTPVIIFRHLQIYIIFMSIPFLCFRFDYINYTQSQIKQFSYY